MKRATSPGATLAVMVMATVAFAQSACANLDHLDLCQVEGDPSAQISAEGVRVRRGTAVAVQLIPYTSSDKVLEDHVDVTLQSKNPQVLDVAPLAGSPGPSDCEAASDRARYFVLWGNGAGATELIVQVDGVEDRTIEAQVF